MDQKVKKASTYVATPARKLVLKRGEYLRMHMGLIGQMNHMQRLEREIHELEGSKEYIPSAGYIQSMAGFLVEDENRLRARFNQLSKEESQLRWHNRMEAKQLRKANKSVRPLHIKE